jgi:hypothetical protein
MITQGTLAYQVIGSKDDGFRIWLRDVNRHFFDSFPGKSSMHLNDDTNQYYHLKFVKHRGTEICLVCNEDENGHRYGVDDPEINVLALPAPEVDCS